MIHNDKIYTLYGKLVPFLESASMILSAKDSSHFKHF